MVPEHRHPKKTKTCRRQAHRSPMARQTTKTRLDLVGAGLGEMVIIAQGSSARQTSLTFEKPIDAVIAGIVDLVEEDGTVVFRK